MKRFLMPAICLLVPVLSSSDTVEEQAAAYIGLYSDAAVSEMVRSGVPASISLAQGMLESAYGRSSLATSSNNHFGIKCHSDWQGESVRADDDARGECFRKYADPLESYRDHSDFLRFKPRYAFLFDFDRSDYRSWAYGLKKAGYATDPEYASKLIRLIEAYDLGRFDKLTADAAAGMPSSPAELKQPVRFIGKGRTGTYSVSLQRERMMMNGTPFVYARSGETYRSIASMYDLYPRELAGFNDRRDADTRLSAGEPVYLARKSKGAVKGLEKHICSEGESLWSISQKYAVRLKSLMKLNGIEDADMRMREDNTVLLRALETER